MTAAENMGGVFVGPDAAIDHDRIALAELKTPHGFMLGDEIARTILASDWFRTHRRPKATPLALTEFLFDRIAEDERAAGHSRIHDPGMCSDCDHGRTLGDPLRVVHECASKRQIAARAMAVYEHDGGGLGILKILASPYRYHADYREEWG